MDIFILIMGAYAAVVAFGVWLAKAKLTRLPYFLICGGLGALSGAISANGTYLPTPFYYLMGFVCGWAIGGRCNDAGLSKLHAVWAWIPILWMGLLFPPSKSKKGSSEDTSEID